MSDLSASTSSSTTAPTAPPLDDTITVVHIFSVSFSGSTWLNMMLGSHPEAVALGELKPIYRGRELSCQYHGAECPVWSRFDRDSDENVFEQLARLTGRRVLVLNRSRRFVEHQHASSRVVSRFVHLYRDGRAVTASMLRKGRHPNMWQAARAWHRNVRRNTRLLRRQGEGAVEPVCYERLAEQPETELRRLCDFIGLTYDPRMLEYWQHAHHPLDGNAGTLYAATRNSDAASETAHQQVAENAKAGNYSLAPYQTGKPTAWKDERWKNELTDRQLRTFAIAAGRLNRRLGYGRATDRQ